MDEMLDYIYDNFTAFQLLLEASYGTKFQNFVEQLAEVEAEYTYKFMEVIHFQNDEENEVTGEFIHIMTRALFDSMFEVVRHKMEKETARNYVHMLEKFNYAGWNTILKFEV
jgi:transcriptional regulator, tetR family